MSLIGTWCDARVEAALAKCDAKLGAITQEYNDVRRRIKGYDDNRQMRWDMEKINREITKRMNEHTEKENKLLRDRLDEMDRRMEAIAAALYAKLPERTEKRP